MATDDKKKPAAGSTEDLLREENVEARSSKFLVMGARREGGQLLPVLFKPTRELADAAAEAMTATGFHTVEVYTLVSSHSKA